MKVGHWAGTGAVHAPAIPLPCACAYHLDGTAPGQAHCATFVLTSAFCRTLMCLDGMPQDCRVADKLWQAQAAGVAAVLLFPSSGRDTYTDLPPAAASENGAMK